MSDEVMAVNAILLLPQTRTKLEAAFQVQARGGEGDDVKEGLEVAVSSKVRVLYGEELKERRMADWVDGRLKEDEGPGAWGRVVGRLEERLKSRVKK